jgi:hypothetical protein
MGARVATALVLLVIQVVSADVSPVERAALIDLYEATSGDVWANFSGSNWLDGDPCVNSWAFVGCECQNTTVMYVLGYLSNTLGTASCNSLICTSCWGSLALKMNGTLTSQVALQCDSGT